VSPSDSLASGTRGTTDCSPLPRLGGARTPAIRTAVQSDRGSRWPGPARQQVRRQPRRRGPVPRGVGGGRPVLQTSAGYISAQLHRGIAGSCAFLNIAVWESVDHFRLAFTAPEFREQLSHYPANAVASPYMFLKVAVSNICVE
jgi:Antibiotic biosynthesis monooxygenase